MPTVSGDRVIGSGLIPSRTNSALMNFMSNSALWITSRKVADEIQELTADLGENRFVPQELLRQPMDR